MHQQFKPGHIVMTAGLHAELGDHVGFQEAVRGLLDRHLSGDFGDMPGEDIKVQNAALEAEKLNPDNAERMMSSYTLFGEKVWLITEWDRSVTTLLFPSEY